MDQLTVELPTAGPEAARQTLRVAAGEAELGEALAVEPGASLEIALAPLDALDPDAVAAPRRRPLAVARRLASEGRDRLRPLAARIA